MQNEREPKGDFKLNKLVTLQESGARKLPLDTGLDLPYTDYQSMNDLRSGIGGKPMGTAGRREREKAKRRKDILQAAREVFFSNGIRRATIDDVAARAEVSKGTVYLYFESKEAILAHLVLEGLDILSDHLQAAYAPQKDLAADERVRRLSRAYLKFSKTQPQYFRLLMAFDRGQFRERVPAPLYQQVSERSLQSLSWVERAFEQGRADSQFDISDSRRAAGVLWASLNGVMFLLDHPLRQEILGISLDTLFDSTLELLLRGMETGPAAQRSPKTQKGAQA
jgi:AcrR family transcriptional regulator